MKGCGVELRVGDLQMNAWTWRVYDTVKARRGTLYVCYGHAFGRHLVEFVYYYLSPNEQGCGFITPRTYLNFKVL